MPTSDQPFTRRGATQAPRRRTVRCMRTRRIRLLPALLALLVAGCGLVGGDTSPSADPSTPSPTVGATSSPTAGVPGYRTTDCGGGPEEFALLCEVHSLILDRHVEPPTVDALASAAAESLADVEDPEALDDGELTCALPADEYRTVCDALAQVGGPLDERIEEAVDGMVRAALDPYSDYQDPTDRALADEQRTGTVEGIGALVTTQRVPPPNDPEAEPCTVLSETCQMVVVSVFDGSPAAEAGVRADDVMVSVDGQDVAGSSLDEVVSKVRGPAGTDVTIGLLRDGETEELTITRAAIDLEIIRTETPRPGVAYIRLTVFSNNADELFREALQELLRDDPETLVLDLRDNPGGSLNGAVDIASEFLDEGLVLRTESPDDEVPYPVTEGGLATGDNPRLVVLVNEGSASASEVVAGALQEAGRAVLVGEPTFGKNTVQNTYSLENGGALKLTIARWVTPSGHDFGRTGIVPDVHLELAPDLDVEEVVDRALEATGGRPAEESDA